MTSSDDSNKLESQQPLRLKSNKAKCKLCGDVIESKSRHDFVVCRCGEIFVDGGVHYLRRGAKDLNNIIDMSETEGFIE